MCRVQVEVQKQRPADGTIVAWRGPGLLYATTVGFVGSGHKSKAKERCNLTNNGRMKVKARANGAS